MAIGPSAGKASSSGGHAVVVGAGLGGLVAALLLAARGMAVTIVDRAPGVGGRLRPTPLDDVSIDAGPSTCIRPDLFDALFDEAAIDRAMRPDFRRCDVIARHAWNHRDRLDLLADPDRMRDAIARFSGPGDARGYDAFRAEARACFETLGAPALARDVAGDLPPPRFDLAAMSTLLGGGSRERLWRALGRHFGDPRLRQLFARSATALGSSPWRAPAAIMLASHLEEQGVWTIGGGEARLVALIEAAARVRGVTFMTDADCRAIEIGTEGATGVRLNGGGYIAADAVVCATDTGALADGWFGEDACTAVPAIQPGDRSLSAVSWAFTARTGGMPLARGNVFLPRDSVAEFRDVLAGWLPEEPTVMLDALDRGDDTQPGDIGRERLRMTIHAPAEAEGRSLSAAELRAGESMALRRLAACGVQLVDCSEVVMTTPADLASRYPGTGGALHGRAMHGWSSVLRRPGPRTRIPRLYVAGATADPGPGLTQTMLSGRYAADSVIADRGHDAWTPPLRRALA